VNNQPSAHQNQGVHGASLQGGGERGHGRERTVQGEKGTAKKTYQLAKGKNLKGKTATKLACCAEKKKGKDNHALNGLNDEKRSKKKDKGTPRGAQGRKTASHQQGSEKLPSPALNEARGVVKITARKKVERKAQMISLVEKKIFREMDGKGAIWVNSTSR